MASTPLQPVVQEVLQTVESQIDDEMHKLDQLTVSDLDKIRRKRLEEMKNEAKRKAEWLAQGHGEYSEISEKEFFDATRKSSRIVCHFYTISADRCRLLDRHLKQLAEKHLETRFVQLNAEKCPFLTKELSVHVIPTILLIRDSQVIHRVIGFTELGNRDDFSTDLLEWKLGYWGIIEADQEFRPETGKRSCFRRLDAKKTIRDRSDDSDSE